MNVHFKNGDKLTIPDKYGEVISANISKGAAEWQCFNESGKTILMINLREVSAFVDEQELKSAYKHYQNK